MSNRQHGGDEPGGGLSADRRCVGALEPEAGGRKHRGDRLLTLLAAFDRGACIVGPDFEIQYANPALYREFGPIEGRKCYDYFDGRSSPCIPCGNEEVFAGKSLHRQWTDEKTGRTYDVCSTPLENEDGTFSNLKYFDDITERKNAENALRESEERFRIAVENAPDGIFIQTNLRFAYLNSAAATLFGAHSPEELLGQPIMDRFHPDCHDVIRARIRVLNEERESVPVLEQVYLKMDGTPFDVEVSAAPFTYENDRGAIVFFRDICKRKEAETERRSLEAQLRQTQKMEAIGTLAGGIAHDFNNILSAVMGYSEISMDMIPVDSPLYSNLQEVLRAGRRAKDLVKQILTFSRLSEKEHRPVEIGSIAKETFKLLRATLPATIEIRQNIAASPRSTTMADPTQIHQVIMNLCANAAHAMREKGGILEVGLSDAVLSETDPRPRPELPPGSYLKLSVSDTGHGMDESLQGQIFDPFFTTKPRGEGTGMGLAVVHGIVKNCGGAIEVQSTPGVGSTFNLFFPAVEAGKEEAQAPPREPPTGKGRILFVDDEEALGVVAGTMLKRLGYSVTVMKDSIEALEAFQSRPDGFDLLVTDHTMPRMTGLSLALEARRIRPDLPVIICSGYSDAINEETAADFGIEHYVQKPFDRRLLARTVKAALAGDRTVE